MKSKLKTGMIAGLLAGSLAFGSWLSANFEAQAAPRPISLTINDKALNTDSPPLIESGRVMLPLRTAAEALGGRVIWDKATRRAVVQKGSQELIFRPGSKDYLVNGRVNKLDVAPILRQNRLLLPVRFLGEKLGFQVRYQRNEHRVYINELKPYQALKPRLSWRVPFGNSIEFKLVVKNEAGIPVYLTLMDGQDFDMVVTRDGEQVYRWSDGKMFTEALRPIVYQPGEEKEFSWEWFPPAPGKYNLEVYYLGIDRENPVLTEELEVNWEPSA